ncbi:MAG: hypothetical protein KDC76_00585 [Bacteroidetes bacterium]|nr:hypothetical protein [Bacteroidota bacterium]
MPLRLIITDRGFFRRRNLFYFLGMVLLVTASPINLSAQIRFSDQVQLYGNSRFFYQNYAFSSEQSVPAVARRPKNYMRFTMNATLQAYQLKIPITIRLANATVSPLWDTPTKPNLGQFIRHPGNVIRLSPTIKNIKFDLGSHTPVYSPLSVGDLQLFGGGASYKVSNYEFRLNAGASQSPVENVTFKKYMIAGRVMRRFNAGQYAALNIVSLRDLKNSVDSVPLMWFDVPEAGLTITAEGRYNLTSKLAVKAEVGQNAFTPNRTVDSLNNEGSLASVFLPSGSGAISGIATYLETEYRERDYGVKLIGKYIGKDYVMLGYPFQVRDVMDILLAPYGYFLNRKLTLKGNVGRRANNVSGRQEGLRTSQFLMNIGGVYLPTRNFDLNFNLANYGVRTNTVNDTFNIHIIAQTISINPVYRFEKSGIKHTISGNALLDRYDDATRLTDTINDNTVTNLSARYQAVISLYTAGLTVGSYRFRQPNRDFNINSVTVSGAAQLLKKKLSTRLAITRAKTANDGVTFGTRMFFDLRARYNVSSKLNAELNFFNNRFTYGDGQNLPFMNELMNRIILNYRF